MTAPRDNRPWHLKVRVGGVWLQQKTPWRYATAAAAKNAADSHWRGALIQIDKLDPHGVVVEWWTRVDGSWFHDVAARVEPPAPVAPPLAPTERWWDR